MNSIKISVVVLTKNEEKDIRECLQNLKWCDEIIVVDDNSQDKTLEIIKTQYNEKVIILERELNNDFYAQRNFGLDKTKGEWVLFIDADERVSWELENEIKNVISEDEYDGFYIKRTDFMWGKKLQYGEAGNIKLLRLAKKNKGKWEGKVHEKWNINGRIGYLNNPILHYPHKTISEFLKKINFYTSLRAMELYEQGKSVNLLTIILYTKIKFLQNYILRLGFKDGIRGFIVAIMMSFHSFLVRSKLWLLHTKNE